MDAFHEFCELLANKDDFEFTIQDHNIVAKHEDGIYKVFYDDLNVAQYQIFNYPDTHSEWFIYRGELVPTMAGMAFEHVATKLLDALYVTACEEDDKGASKMWVFYSRPDYEQCIEEINF